jgi:hypothetical protein
MFKRQYADSTLLDASNTDDISSLADGSLRGYNYAHNLPFPRHITATNIPLLQHSSLSSYFDIMHKIDTSNVKEPQDYLKSVFEENIDKLRLSKQIEHQKLLHEYDLVSRRNILYKYPVFGHDMFRQVRLLNLIENPSNKPIIYGNDKQADHLVNNSVINKYFKDYLRINSLTNPTQEALYDHNKIHIETEVAPTEDIVIPIDDEQAQAQPQPQPQSKPIPPPFKTRSNAEHINKIKEDFIPANYSFKDSINFTSTDTLHNVIMTPNKVMHLCEELMNNFRIHIPNVISKGPQLVSSKFRTDFYVNII